MIVIATEIPAIEQIVWDAFAKYAPPDSYCGMDDIRAQEATTAACWFPSVDKLMHLPKLGLIHSMAAGVEHLNIHALNGKYKVCRIVDESHKSAMLSYLLWGILYFQRHFDHYLKNNQKAVWQQFPQRPSSEFCVGIMGLGEIGHHVAEQLRDRGYPVVGWSNSAKTIAGVKTFAGQEQFVDFIQHPQVLINLLPLTAETQNILSAKTFDLLPQGAAIINTGRGGHLNAADLFAALDSGHLRGAILDVFEHEPLSPDNPLWHHPNIVVTPHIASHADLNVVVQQIVQNDQSIMAGKSLLNEVDLVRGY